MNYDCLKITFEEYVVKIKALPVKKKIELDGVLLDLANYAFDTYEFICEPPEITESETKVVVEYLNSLLERTTEILDFLEDIDFSSKNMNRATYILGEIEDGIPELIEQLEG